MFSLSPVLTIWTSAKKYHLVNIIEYLLPNIEKYIGRVLDS